MTSTVTHGTSSESRHVGDDPRGNGELRLVGIATARHEYPVGLPVRGSHLLEQLVAVPGDPCVDTGDERFEESVAEILGFHGYRRIRLF